jgi:NADH-quinone oxidoreductase subunit J
VIQFLFVVIAAVGLATAFGTVLARNLVHAALFLVGFFFAIACLFVLLEAEFLAALQVLVYIGAVAILLMFGIMLTRNIQGDDPTSAPSAWQLPGLIAGLGVFLVLAYGIGAQQGLGSQFSWTTRDVRPRISPTPDAVTAAAPVEGTAKVGEVPLAGEAWSRVGSGAVNNMGKVVGVELMTRYVIAFEVAGLLLTAALVGAIATAHREEAEPGAARSGQTAAREAASGQVETAVASR